MSRKWTFCHSLTGGGLGSLDSILSTDITNNSPVITEDSGLIYFHMFSSVSSLAESSPEVIKPDNLSVGSAGRWLLQDVWTGKAATDAIGAVTPAANKLPYFTSATAASTTDLTAAGRILLAIVSAGSANDKLFMNAAGTLPEWHTGIASEQFTRVMSDATGDVSYTGASFLPKAIIVLATVQGAANVFCAGLSVGTAETAISLLPRTSPIWNFANSSVVFIEAGAADGSMNQYAIVKSMDTTGVTLTWTKTGSPTATISGVILYLR